MCRDICQKAFEHVCLGYSLTPDGLEMTIGLQSRSAAVVDISQNLDLPDDGEHLRASITRASASG